MVGAGTGLVDETEFEPHYGFTTAEDLIMSLATQIKPITYLKSNAADIIKEFAVNPEPIIITQNGEAKMVVMDIAEYEKQQETMALLKLISLGRKEFEAGKFSDAEAFLDEMDD
jgi:prevent-host-death family protein